MVIWTTELTVACESKQSHQLSDKPFATFYGDTKHQCLKKAEDAGWKIVDTKALCPTCAQEGGKKE